MMGTTAEERGLEPLELEDWVDRVFATVATESRKDDVAR